MELVTTDMVDKLKKAADKLEQAAQYTAMTQGLGFAELIVALNNYYLAKESYNAELDQRFAEFEQYTN